MSRGWALAEQGGCEEGITQLRVGLKTLTATGQRLALPFFLRLLGEAYAKCGMMVEALATLEEALAAGPEEEVDRPEVLRLRAEFLAVRGADASQVEGGYWEAVALARRLGARSLELRATTSLARLWERQGQPGEARSLLAPLYASFTEGFDTRDLIEAKALLEELA